MSELIIPAMKFLFWAVVVNLFFVVVLLVQILFDKLDRCENTTKSIGPQ